MGASGRRHDSRNSPGVMGFNKSRLSAYSSPRVARLMGQALMVGLVPLVAAIAHAAPAAESAVRGISEEPPVPSAAQAVSFARACEAGESIVISAIGDILPHSGLQEQAYRSKIGFESLWPRLTPYFQQVDIAYGNLEGPAASGVVKGGRLKADPGPVLDQDVYTGTDMRFNYHPRIIDDLKRSGFDIVSMANNHAFDRRSIGIDRTIDAFRERGLLFAGARKTTESGLPQAVITESKGFRVAWIACSESMNGSDAGGQILMCGLNKNEIVSEIQRLSQDRTVDAIMVAPHWGDEYHHIAAKRQRVLARAFLDAGASAIIGSHPHMLQEMESYRTQDGRDTVIAYSLGNFVSGQGKKAGQKLNAMLFIGLTKRSGERAWVNGVSYLPLWMNRGPHAVDVLSKSNGVPTKTTTAVMNALFDPTRELKAGDPIKTNLGCQ
jgi:Bacterial capsule synthesis protein PGA_cap